MQPTARYDPHPAWYDEFASTELFVHLREHVVGMLGSGPDAASISAAGSASRCGSSKTPAGA